jgi:N-acetylneuraminic acid mutarotase
MAVGLTHAGTAVDGQFVYFVGGYPEGATSQSFATNAVYRYDTVANVWDRLPNLPQSRGGGAAALVGRTLHFFGGSDANRQDRTEHWSIDLSSASANWVARTPMPSPRNHFGSVAIGDRFYVIGGQTGQGDTAVYKSEVLVFQPLTNTWSTVAPLLPVRSHIGHATFVRDGRIVVMGGDGQGGTRLSLVSEFDPVGNTWKNLTPLPAARKGGIGGLVGDVLVFSGGNNGGVQRTTWIGEFV